MKQLMMAVLVAATLNAFAADTKKSENKAPENAQIEEESAPILWGFANYGWYSGYQLYGSIVNTEPTLQGYVELNANLPFAVGPLDDLGYLGAGIWNNSDLTGKRSESYRRAFNEFDFNAHWGKTFWFDEERQWGLGYRMSFVWYYYPQTGGRPYTKTTFDWNHSFELINPYLIPYINVVHEYKESDGNLLQFGVKKPWQITKEFSVCPFIEMVWRNRNYGWCFSNFGRDPRSGEKLEAGLATLKLELDATYMFTDWIGVFAKVAYCQNLDPSLRDAARELGTYGGGAEYGRYNEFCWGGVGVCVNF